jgi:import inner membrane translocase subunit TIM23
MSSADRQPDTAQGLLRSTQFSQGGPSSVTDFSDAQAILSAPNLAALHPLANISDKELDYLQLEDDRLNQLEGTKGILPSRGRYTALGSFGSLIMGLGWGDELCYGTGSTYLTGQSPRIGSTSHL